MGPINEVEASELGANEPEGNSGARLHVHAELSHVIASGAGG